MTDMSARADAAPATPVAAVTHPDPYPYYAELVAQRPLHRDATLGLWVAASAAAVTAVLTSDLVRVRPLDEPVPAALLGSAAGDFFGRLVRMNDGPRHASVKPAIVSVLDGLDLARVRAVALRCADRIAAELSPATRPDRIGDVAFALAPTVIAELLGFARDAADAAARWTAALVRGIAPGAGAQPVQDAAEAATRLVDLARAVPVDGDGLLAGLLRAAPDDRDAITANAIGFLTQSYDATAGLLGNTLVALSRSAALREPARAPGTLARMVAEVARHDAPVQNTRRFVAEDGVVAGTTMRRGEAILVVLAAANRDPAANSDPARFDHERKEPRTFTFGMGPHACPGAALAITIAAAGVEGLLASGLVVDQLGTRMTYRASPNARIPVFAAL